MHAIIIKFLLFGTHKLTANYYYRLIISIYNVNYLKYVNVLGYETSLMKYNKYLLSIFHVPSCIKKDSDIKMKHANMYVYVLQQVHIF